MLHAGWRGLARRRRRRRACARCASSARRRDRAPRSGRGARRCCYEVGEEVHAAFARLGPAARRGATSTSRPSRARSCARRASREVHDVGLCTICATRSCSSPTAATAASPGARRGSRGGADPRPRRRARAREPRSRSRAEIAAACARAGRDPADVELLAAVKYVAARGARRARRGRHHARSARTARRTSRPRRERIGRALHVGLHRPAPEPQGASRSLPHVRLIHSVATDSVLAQLERHGDAARPRSWSRSTSPARRPRAGSRPAELGAFLDALPGARRRPDDDAAVRRGPRGRAARGSPALRELAARARAASSSRWAPPRTTRSPSRRARRSCGSARRCIA